MDENKIKEYLNVFIGFLVILFLLQWAGAFSVDSLFDDDGKSVLKKHKQFQVSGLTVSQYKSFINSNPTELQRDNFIKLQRDKVIQWTARVEDIERNRSYFIVKIENDFVPQNDVLRLMADGIRYFSGTDNFNHVESACGRVSMYPIDNNDSVAIASLSKGDAFRFEGVIDDFRSGNCLSIKYGLLSKDQSNLSDSGYQSEFMSLAKEVAVGVKNGLEEGLKDLNKKSSEKTTKDPVPARSNSILIKEQNNKLFFNSADPVGVLVGTGGVLFTLILIPFCINFRLKILNKPMNDDGISIVKFVLFLEAICLVISAYFSLDNSFYLYLFIVILAFAWSVFESLKIFNYKNYNQSKIDINIKSNLFKDSEIEGDGNFKRNSILISDVASGKCKDDCLSFLELNGFKIENHVENIWKIKNPFTENFKFATNLGELYEIREEYLNSNKKILHPRYEFNNEHKKDASEKPELAFSNRLLLIGFAVAVFGLLIYASTSTLPDNKKEVSVEPSDTKFKDFLIQKKISINKFNIVSSADFSGDSQADYILEGKSEYYCGSAGCLTVVIFSSKQGYQIAFSDMAYKTTILNKNSDGRSNLRLDLHSSNCNSYDADVCVKKLVWNGTKMVLR
jgi:hypothetical protein